MRILRAMVSGIALVLDLIEPNLGSLCTCRLGFPDQRCGLGVNTLCCAFNVKKTSEIIW